MKPIKTKELKDIVWEAASCPFCGGNYSPVLLNKEPLQSGQFDYKVHPVICECGLVYLNPRWSSETYSKFYEEVWVLARKNSIKKKYKKSNKLKQQQLNVLNRFLP